MRTNKQQSLGTGILMLRLKIISKLYLSLNDDGRFVWWWAVHKVSSQANERSFLAITLTWGHLLYLIYVTVGIMLKNYVCTSPIKQRRRQLSACLSVPPTYCQPRTTSRPRPHNKASQPRSLLVFPVRSEILLTKRTTKQFDVYLFIYK